MSQSFKICPICRTPANRTAVWCSNCGASLNNVEPVMVQQTVRRARTQTAYDHLHGETDLFEGGLHRRRELLFFSIFLLAVVLGCIASALFLTPRFFAALAPVQITATVTSVPTRVGTPIPLASLATNTPRPTLDFATITPAPPTATETPTQGPCMVQVQANDSLIGLASECGHRSLDVIPLIVEINDLGAPENIQAGQNLEIPWPTATDDPNTAPTEAANADEEEDVWAAAQSSTLAPVEEALSRSQAIATQTLQPGVMWHQVANNENILVIAYRYGASVEIMSQLNLEVTFSQCDYGMDSGGPNCSVQIYQGQLLRVPAPTPTPTIPPTASGSETPTPTPTATFNAPSAISPDNRSLFQRNQLITLRWVATATLGAGQTYRVQVEDTTLGVAYTQDTLDIFFIIPEDWQGQDSRRHDYLWTVSVIDIERPDQPYFTTQPRIFSWEGRGETN